MSAPAGAPRRRTFEALSVSRNFRRYFVGQTVSLAGTWMQSVAQGWLVLQLTGSPTQVGLLAAVQTLPVLLFGPSSGVVVDRVDTRRLLVITQTVSGVLAGLLALLTATGHVRLWVVYVLAGVLGMVTAIDNPARLAFVSELVPPQHLPNAVTLNSVNMNAARVIGPSIAALVIALGGVSLAFALNAASYGVVVVALLLLRARELYDRRREPPKRGQLREGLTYVWRHAELRSALIMMTLIGTLTYEFTVSLPAYAKETFGGGATLFSLMTGAMGLGAVVGGLATAHRPRQGVDVVARQSAIFGAVVLLAAAAPTGPIAIVFLTFVGAASLVFIARANATVQLLADPSKRGRVMALWTVAFLGTTPVGAPIIGWTGEHVGPRWALVVGGVAALISAAYGFVVVRRPASPARPAGRPTPAVAQSAMPAAEPPLGSGSPATNARSVSKPSAVTATNSTE